MKIHLLITKKWKTLEDRISKLEAYLSATSRLGGIYGDIKITYDVVSLSELTLNSEGVYNMKDILKITKPYHVGNDAVGVVFPFIKGEKYAGNYYPNDGSEYKLDFYIKADEKTRYDSNTYSFEEFVEHEIAHAVSLDLELNAQGINTGFMTGADNTHYYFYKNKKEEFYKEVNLAWKKKFNIFKQMLEASSKLLSTLFKKKL